MNFARIALAGLAAWIASIPVGYLVNEVILNGLFTANEGAFRPDAT